MKTTLTFILCLIAFNTLATSNSFIEYREITDKKDVFKFLFRKHHILLNPDCHRNVFEGRGAKVYVAMGCKITKLEIDKSQASKTMVEIKAGYHCDGDSYPFSAHCELK